MIEKTVKILNSAGIHCRPSSVIINAAEEFKGNEFEISAASGTVDLSSIVGLLSLGLQCGDTVTIKATGPQEKAACERMAELFQHHFDFPPRN